MEKLTGKVVVVTGASSGFGEAIATALAGQGVRLALGARREKRLEVLAQKLSDAHGVQILTHPVDVQETKEVDDFVRATIDRFGRIDILVNNAGLALGKRDILTADEADWQQMVGTNFFGVFRMTRRVLEDMLPRKQGHIVNIGSIAAHHTYEGGGGYCASKFAMRAMTEILRMELVDKNIRVTAVDPGMAETEFSLVRFKGDAENAKKVYEGMRPLVAQDVAECVLFAVTRPLHVNIDDIVVSSTDQAFAGKVIRRTPEELFALARPR